MGGRLRWGLDCHFIAEKIGIPFAVYGTTTGVTFPLRGSMDWGNTGGIVCVRVGCLHNWCRCTFVEEHHRRGEIMITEDRSLKSEQCERVGEHKWAIGLVRRRTCVLLAGRWFGGWGGLVLIICVPLYVGEDQRACW